MADEDLHPAALLAAHVLRATSTTRHLTAGHAGGFLPGAAATHRILRLAYDASLLEEEGRFPSVRIVCHHAEPTVRFTDEVPLSHADALRRIAPTARRRGSALALRADDPADIRCRGVYEFADVIDPVSLRGRAGSWETTAEILSGTLFSARIEGPGRIRAGFLPADAFLLRGGEVRRRRYWTDVGPVEAVIATAAENLLGSLPDDVEVLQKWVVSTPGQTLTLLGRMLGHLLSSTAEAGRGGTFVVLLGDQGADVRSGYPSVVDMRKVYRDAIIGALNDSNHEDLGSFARAWAMWRTTLFKVVEQVAGLSSVDGCVVFDRNFSLSRFGAKLYFEGKRELPDELKGTGTRHSSTYHFCCENPALAFVISQDGHLTAICSTQPGAAEVHRDLDPGLTWIQQ
ncbi:putative sensor domain DACNV-containing protein [Limnoglobus roseus]|uniref:Probable sensor domain-containing protein n=1 Tax=Limnoglobus roseus TaxID=2598579 RepID=A0A5C1A4W2_9BACT|nr:hypothetical protein [Limnoglobus roseus]QEL13437.1 hypothetical protein PX52LOC_00294 [Limnoglobus roseus]